MNELFSNNWFTWFFSTYSIGLGLAPIVTVFILKMIAIFHPGIPTDKIVDLIQKTFTKSDTNPAE